MDQQGQSLNGSTPLSLQSALALASCDALGGDYQKALPVAASIDLILNFTLVHGDVQAGRAEPGDRPSIWWVWGPAQAINAGDGLHALGRTTMMRLAQNGVPAEKVLKAVRSLDLACLALCEGQYMDLQFQDQMLVSVPDYMDMISPPPPTPSPPCAPATRWLASRGTLVTGRRQRRRLRYFQRGRAENGNGLADFSGH